MAEPGTDAEAPAEYRLTETCANCGALLPTDQMLDRCPACGFNLRRARLRSTRHRSSGHGVGPLVGLLGPVGGAGITAGLLAALQPQAAQHDIIRRLFLPGTWENAVPWSICYLTVWALVVVTARWWCCRGQRRFLRAGVLEGIEQCLDRDDVEVARLQLASRGDVERSLLVSQLRRALHEWIATEDRQQVRDALRFETDGEMERIQGGYVLVRTFTWAIPILGFIGTVLGIGAAVGHFGSFLGGEVESVDLIRSELIRVTQGLSYAFDTTLLGLVAAVLVMLPSVWAQRAEESLVSQVEQLIEQRVIIRLPTAKTDGAIGAGGLVQILRSELDEWSKAHLKLQHQAMRQYGRYLESILRQRHDDSGQESRLGTSG